MAMNQTQRDHAIKMVKEAIAAKKELFKKPYPTPKEFLSFYFSSIGLHDMTMDALLVAAKESSAHWVNGEYVKGVTLDLFSIGDSQQAYNLACEMITNQFKRDTADLDALENKLVGEIMFGKDSEVVAAAMKAIADFKNEQPPCPEQKTQPKSNATVISRPKKAKKRR